jgi:hypothetical protein
LVGPREEAARTEKLCFVPREKAAIINAQKPHAELRAKSGVGSSLPVCVA